MTFRLSRRAVLLGAGGATIGLPWLEAMSPSRRAHAQTMPSRYCIVFAGQALGGDGWADNSSMVAGERRTMPNQHIVPTETGAAYTITEPLRPLETMRDQFSIVSNMRIPYSTTSAEASEVPAGGAFREFHGGGASPLLTGMRSISGSFRARGVSSDIVMSGLHPMHEPLVLRAQPAWYLAGSSYAGRNYVSYRGDADPIEAQDSPQRAFNSLFGGFMPMTDDPAEAARADFVRRTRRSVLDAVLSRRDRLLARLGRADRERIQRHFDELRDLELRIADIPPPATGGCVVPADPGTDSPIGGDNDGTGADEIRPGDGYSNETERAQVMADLIAMAFACDLARVASFQITVFQSHMNVHPITSALGMPVLADLHEVGHNGDPSNRGQEPVSMMLRWHIQAYARLLDRMRTTMEGDGSVLDHSAVLFVPEAGHGTQLNDASSENATHSVEKMVMLIAGRANGGLAPGQHVDSAGAHPAQCLISAMQAAGYDRDTLGEVQGNISALQT